MWNKRALREPVVLIAALILMAGCEGKDTEPTPAPTSAPEPTSEAPAIDQEELDALRALGYVSVVEDHDENAEVGVLLGADREDARELIYYTNAFGCSSILMRWTGEVVNRWSHEPCYRWGNTVLLPDGDILAIHRIPVNLESPAEVFQSFRLLRMSWDGELRFSTRLPLHHDLDVLPDGRIATLTYRHEYIEDIDAEVPIRNHYVSILSPRGEVIEEASITHLLRSDPSVFQLQKVKRSTREGYDEVDLIHSNAIEWMHSEELAAKDPIYALSNVLVTLRHQDAVVIFNWETKKVVWAWGQNEISGPHDGHVLPNGNILLFDNGIGRRWSRVIELDPLSREIVWEYRAEDPTTFYTSTRGAAHRLPNGNTLITNSKWGMLFEVTPEGEVVWNFRNPVTDEKGRPSIIVRARHLLGKTDTAPPFPRTDTPSS